MTIIAYLGPAGTYSHAAAKSLGAKLTQANPTDNITYKDEPSLNQVVHNVATGAVTHGIMAVDNYLEGLVQETLDLIYEQRIHINGLQRVPVVLSLGVPPHCDPAKQTQVYSHPKALAQCSDYLMQHYPSCRQIAASSTAAAAQERAKTQSGLAIGPAETLQNYGLQILAENIGNRRRGHANYTDFYVVTKEAYVADNNNAQMKGVHENEPHDTTMVAILPLENKPRVLLNILSIVGKYNLNLRNIHSRPSLLPDISGIHIPSNAQMFYLDVEEAPCAEAMEQCLDDTRKNLGCTDVEHKLELVRVLGSYKRQ